MVIYLDSLFYIWKNALVDNSLVHRTVQPHDTDFFFDREYFCIFTLQVEAISWSDIKPKYKYTNQTT